MESKTNTFKIAKTKEGQLVYYIGRNGKQYPILAKSLLLFHDAPEDPKPYAMFFWNSDDDTTLGSYLSQAEFEELKKKENIKYYDPDLSTHTLQ